MKLNLIQNSDVAFAKKKLENYYDGNLIPAEKKQYLTNLRASHGPYMGIDTGTDETHYMMDAASQIATLGLGFNSNVFLGPAHHLESWTNENHTKNAKSLRASLDAFLKRKTGLANLSTTLCNSGAEANEIALGYCFENRKNSKANKVLAFNGSFHGRMMVTLQATWNPSKREPFLIPGFDTVFCPFPELDGDKILQVFPENWREFWNDSTSKEIDTPAEWRKDHELALELDSLLSVREELLKGSIFSIIVEPMQCEGGDRYASDRFNTALLLMAKSFGVSVIHDEVQTGFHLGREFFWHKMFNLKDLNGELLAPEYIVCAKKAQVGIVISQKKETSHTEEFSMVSMIRGLYHGLALDQAQESICQLEEKARVRLDKLVTKYSDYIGRPRLMGVSFAFDLNDKSKVAAFIAARFDHGLLYYPAGDKTLRFRLNTAFKDKDLDFLFERLEQIILKVLVNKSEELVSSVQTNARAPQNTYKWHEKLVTQRLAALNGIGMSQVDAWRSAEETLTGKDGLEGSQLVKLTKENFSKYSSDIQAIQEETYEKSRQTSLETFEKSVLDGNGIALLLIKSEKIQAMAISGMIGNFPNERVLKRDESFADNKTLYMVDCTVRSTHARKGLGRQIKSALNLISMAAGKRAVVGRNRDRLAGTMLSINLSLGAREEFYVEEDYLDNETHRDVIYYKNNLTWEDSDYRLDNALASPLSSNQLDSSYLTEQLPFLANKVCLSNFVSLRYLDHIKELFHELPIELRHGYSASGQSECVDKLSKSMFVADKKRHKMISFTGHYFGSGSFMSRALSGLGENYFPVDYFNSPNIDNWNDILKSIKTRVKPDEVLSIWIEPLPQKLLTPVPLEFLKELRSWTKENKINLVYNESASAVYRYDEDHFCASTIKEISPDAGFIFMGGQAALVYANEDNFMSKPLMMISTWDGDEFSYANYTKSLKAIKSDFDSFKETRNKFTEKLASLFKDHNISQFQIHNGVGTVTGDLPHSLTKLMTLTSSGNYLFNPSYGSMKKFLKDNK